MSDLFSRRRDIPGCPWIKQNQLGKWSNEKLHISTLVNDGTLRSTQSAADFASPLSNVNNVKMSDVLEFIVMLLFFSLCSYKSRLWKHPLGRFFFDNLKKISSGSFFPFSPATLQKHTWMATFLWSYLL